MCMSIQERIDLVYDGTMSVIQAIFTEDGAEGEEVDGEYRNSQNTPHPHH